MKVSSINKSFWKAILGTKQLKLLTKRKRENAKILRNQGTMYSPWEALLFLFLLYKALRLKYFCVYILRLQLKRRDFGSFAPLHI